MYVFRVVPNSVICKSRMGGTIPLQEIAFLGAEDIYYNMGYTSFIDEVGTKDKDWYDTLNTVKSEKDHKGKFFYLFPDEALQNASTIICDFGNKYGSTYCLLVYDFPIDMILENIGYGTYLGKQREYVLETCIDVEQFGNNLINSADIRDIDKFNTLKSFFKESILKEYNYFSQYHIDALLQYLLKLGNSVIEQLDSDKWLDSTIRNSELYNNLLNYNGVLIKNDYITGINIPINASWYSKNTFEKKDEFISSFFKEYGIDTPINNYDTRDEILRQLRNNPTNKENIGKMLMKR